MDRQVVAQELLKIAKELSGLYGPEDKQQEVPSNLRSMDLSKIARLIQSDWKKVNFGAVPYLKAMRSLSDINDMYGMDDGKTVVMYFLSNATTWRGPVAKAVKLELKKRLKK